MKIVTVEYVHKQPQFTIRGGRFTADHVDIMGNHKLIEEVLKIVTGHQNEVQDRISSKILEYAERVKL